MAYLGTLHPYQDAAANLVWDEERVFVAYDMGLGKTHVALCALEEIMDAGRARGGTVVCPDPLKWQWHDAVREFTDSDVIVIDGTYTQRVKQLEQIRTEKPRWVVCTYDWINNNRELRSSLPSDFVVLDEATYIGKPNTQRTKACLNFRAQARYRIALTGTGFDNSLPEFFSASEWVERGRLGSYDSFDLMFHDRDPKFGKVLRVRNIDLLWEMCDGWLIRKAATDPDVAPFMPEVEHYKARAYLTHKGLRLYETVVSDILAEMDNSGSAGDFNLATLYTGEADAGKKRGRVMARIGALAMACTNPNLLRRAAERYVETDKKHGSEYAFELMMDGRLPDGEVAAPKLDAVVEYTRSILRHDPQNKVVIFSFWRDNIDYIAAALADDCRVAEFHGGMTSKRKHAQKVSFQRDPDVRVFLSSDAGGYGIDLPQANYLLNVDPPWSAGKAAQRNSRIIRASSRFDLVTIVDFIVPDSVDAWRWHVMNDKRRLQKAVLDRQVGSKTELRPSTKGLVKYLAAHVPEARS